MARLAKPKKEIECSKVHAPTAVSLMRFYLHRDKIVRVYGLGYFQVKPIKSRIMFHNKGKRNIRTKSGFKIKFIPASDFAQYVKEI